MMAPWKSALRSFCCTNSGLLQRQHDMRLNTQKERVTSEVVSNLLWFTGVEFQTVEPVWFQSVAEVSDVLSPELMQRQEQVVSTIKMEEKTVTLMRRD